MCKNDQNGRMNVSVVMAKNGKKILDANRGRALRIGIGVIVLIILTLIQGAAADILSDGGVLYTSDTADRLWVAVERNAVASDSVEFVLQSSPSITWRKEIVIREGPTAGSGAWTIYTQDDRHEDRNGLYTYQLNGGSLTFRKAKFLGIMTDVLTLSLDTALPGSRVTFLWECDSGCAVQQSTLSGDLYYPRNGANLPMRNSYFEIWKSGFLGTTSFVTSGTTDGNGHFTATFDGDCDCWVTVFTRIPGTVDVFCPAQSGLLCAPLPGQSPTHHYSFSSVHVNNGENVNIGAQVLPDSTYISEAAYIADTILNAWLFVQGQTGVQVPQVSVQFPCGALCPGRVYFNPYVITDIYMQPGESVETITHEYGHWVMFAAYGGPGSVVADIWPVPFDEQISTDCLNHYQGNTCSPRVAWTEGWAEFFAAAVLGRAGSGDLAQETPSYSATGDGDEGRVAAALWDLDAPSSPSNDHFGVGFTPIFGTLWQHTTHSTLRDFYNDFRNTYPQSTWAFNAAAFQNTINYNNPPRVIDLVAPNSPTAGSVSLSVTGADDTFGYVDGYISSATFEYSVDGGASWVNLGTQPTGLTSPPSSSTTVSYQWNLNFVSPSVIVRARVSDNLGALSDWKQSAPFSVYHPYTIVSPNGGENWEAGETRTINWSSLGNVGEYVKIELLKGGVLDSVINPSTLNRYDPIWSNYGEYKWTIPLTQTLGSDYQIRITSTSNAIFTDTSDNTFTISAPTCRVISSPGTYELTTDVIDRSDTTCIKITSSDVVFDGKGHTIDGKGIGGTYGVYVYNPSTTLTNVTVKNLKVTDWSYGIYYKNVNSGNIENNNASSNTIGIQLDTSNYNALKNNIAILTPFGGMGIGMENSHYNTLTGNTVNQNGGTGIILGGASSGNTLSDNNVSLNGDMGIWLTGSNNYNTFTRNILAGNGFDSGGGRAGIAIGSSSNNILTENIVKNNLRGIILSSSANNKLTRNTVKSNTQSGILLLSSSDNTLTGDIASNNLLWDFQSTSNSLNNTVINLTINPTISFRGKDVAIKSATSPAGDPAGYRNISKYVNATNTSADSWLFLNVIYSDADVAKVNESTLRIWKYAGSWSKVSGTNGVNTLQNYVYTNITSFGIFAPMASIPVPAITVASPNGGENWARGTTQAIRWIYSGSPGSYVKIELLKGGVLNRVINSSTKIGVNGSGSYSWLVNSTQTLGTDYKVRVTSTSNSAYTNTSNNNFTISGGIAVTSPNGGENWARGTTQTIRWTYSGSPGSYVRVELLKGGVLNRIINSSTRIGSNGSGSYNWLINSTQTLGSDYKVRVTSTSNSAYTDISNSNFTISVPSITVASPNGGESWARGTTQTIRWTYSGSSDSYVKIELLKGGVLNRIINSSTKIGVSGSGSYNWLINSTQTLGSDYKVRVTSTSNSAYTDTSNNNFTISGGIAVASPNGGENWAQGTTQMIRWTYSGSPSSYVKIELLKGGVLNRVINSSASVGVSGSGSYNWLINSTQTLGADYKVRITSTTNPAYTDTSNNNFTISAPGITVTSPNGGENWTRGTTQTIRWAYTGTPGSYVKIELLKGGVLSRIINSSTPIGISSTGSYSWLINSTQTLGNDYKVRITSTANPTYTDTSNTNFTIRS